MLSRVSPPPPPPSFGCTLRIVSNIPFGNEKLSIIFFNLEWDKTLQFIFQTSIQLWNMAQETKIPHTHTRTHTYARHKHQNIYLWLYWFDRIYQHLDANRILRAYRSSVNYLCNRYKYVNCDSLERDSLCEIQMFAIATTHWTKHLWM